MKKQITVKGYAKINPTLDVVKIVDNWQVVRRLTWQKINLFDVVHIEISSNPRRNGDIFISCDNPQVPQGQGNLFDDIDSSASKNNCWKAAKVMLEEATKLGIHWNYAIKIDIEKKIPLVGGLGGSASDSAAVMVGLSTLLDLHMIEDELSRVGGKKVGHDASFLVREAALYAGDEHGTIATPIENPQKIYFVRITPKIPISAGEAYDGLIPIQKQFSERDSYPTDEFIHTLRTPQWMREKPYRNMEIEVISTFNNDLELSKNTLSNHPQLAELKKNISQNPSIIKTMMSGSGPTLLGFVTTEKEAMELAQKFQKDYPDCQVGWNFTLDYKVDMIIP